MCWSLDIFPEAQWLYLRVHIYLPQEQIHHLDYLLNYAVPDFDLPHRTDGLTLGHFNHHERKIRLWWIVRRRYWNLQRDHDTLALLHHILDPSLDSGSDFILNRSAPHVQLIHTADPVPGRFDRLDFSLGFQNATVSTSVHQPIAFRDDVNSKHAVHG